MARRKGCTRVDARPFDVKNICCAIYANKVPVVSGTRSLDMTVAIDAYTRGRSSEIGANLMREALWIPAEIYS
jgi:hypothetical protein